MPDGTVLDPAEMTPEHLAYLEYLKTLSDTSSDARAALEAELGARKFRAFFKMAWRWIDPAHLLWNWHIDLLCEEMELVARRHHSEAVFCVPPRSLKSQILSVAFPAWVWTWFPAAKFLTASNEMNLATRDAVRMRALVKTEWYQRRWGPRSPFRPKFLSDGKLNPGVEITGDQDNKTYFETTAGGHRFSCTPRSNVTGHGGDFVLCDDPHPTQKAESEAERTTVLTWWNEAIPTRLNEPDRGVKLVIQQRVHREDLAGACIKKGYHKVVLPMLYDEEHPDRHPNDTRQPGEMLHPARYPGNSLQRLQTALGPYGTAGQLQQRPTAREGGLFKRAWFQIVDAVPASARHNRVRRWDLASTAPEPGRDPDYTAGALLSRDDLGIYYIEDIARFRDEALQVKLALKAIASQDGTSTRIRLPQDPGQAGKAQLKDLVSWLSGYDVRGVQETGDKYTRALIMVAQCAVGNVKLVRGDWNEDFLTEITDFPNGSHDDQVDAVVGGYLELTQGGGGLLDLYRQEAEEIHEEEREQPRDTSVSFQRFG